MCHSLVEKGVGGYIVILFMGWDEKVETERNTKKMMKKLYSILMLHGVFIDTLQR